MLSMLRAGPGQEANITEVSAKTPFINSVLETPIPLIHNSGALQ